MCELFKSDVWWLTPEFIVVYTECVSIPVFLTCRTRKEPHSWNKSYWSSRCIAAMVKKSVTIWCKTKYIQIVHCWSAGTGVSVALTCWEWDPESSGCSAAIANKDTQCHWCKAPEIRPSQYYTSAELQCQQPHTCTRPKVNQDNNS